MMAIGARNRAVAETKMNERSSRSHSVLTVIVDGSNLATGERTHGCLHLIDLAGRSLPCVCKRECTLLWGHIAPKPLLHQCSYSTFSFQLLLEADLHCCCAPLSRMNLEATMRHGPCDLTLRMRTPGSERVGKSEATGDRLEEAKHINRSLSALGDVMAALAAKDRGHVPYRNSRLTQLLQDSLCGSTKVMMFVHVSPEVDPLPHPPA